MQIGELGPVEAELFAIVSEFVQWPKHRKLLCAQIYHETGRLTSRIWLECNNPGGIVFINRHGQSSTCGNQPDGSHAYAAYPTRIVGIQHMALIVHRALAPALSPEDYAQALKGQHYYGDTVENYAAALRFFYDGLQWPVPEAPPPTTLTGSNQIPAGPTPTPTPDPVPPSDPPPTPPTTGPSDQ